MKMPPKVQFHDKGIAKSRGDKTSIPKIQLGTGQLGEKEGKIVYKRRGGTTGKGIQ